VARPRRASAEVAEQLSDPQAKQAVLQLAESYERLARAAENPAVLRRRELARPVATQNRKYEPGRSLEDGSTSRPANPRRTRQDHRITRRESRVL
jgi:hypothetical protein